VATSLENRPLLMRMMEEARGGGGALTESDKLACRVAGIRPSSTQIELNFTQFLKLLSLVRTFKLDRLYKEEQRVIKECDLTFQEVQQFRELFLESASGDGCMTIKDILFLFRNICPLGSRNKAELLEHVEDVVGPRTPGCDVAINFAELMVLMGRLRDTNFGGIRDRFFS